MKMFFIFLCLGTVNNIVDNSFIIKVLDPPLKSNERQVLSNTCQISELNSLKIERADWKILEVLISMGEIIGIMEIC